MKKINLTQFLFCIYTFLCRRNHFASVSQFRHQITIYKDFFMRCNLGVSNVTYSKWSERNSDEGMNNEMRERKLGRNDKKKQVKWGCRCIVLVYKRSLVSRQMKNTVQCMEIRGSRDDKFLTNIHPHIPKKSVIPKTVYCTAYLNWQDNASNYFSKFRHLWWLEYKNKIHSAFQMQG